MPASEKSANSSTQDGYKPDEVHRCSSSRCVLCSKLMTGSSFSSSLTGRKYQVVCDSHMSCDSRHVVYLISCSPRAKVEKDASIKSFVAIVCQHLFEGCNGCT